MKFIGLLLILAATQVHAKFECAPAFILTQPTEKVASDISRIPLGSGHYYGLEQPGSGLRGVTGAALERVGRGYAEEGMVDITHAHEKVFRGWGDTDNWSNHVIAVKEGFQLPRIESNQTPIDARAIFNNVTGFGRVTALVRRSRTEGQSRGSLPIYSDVIRISDLNDVILGFENTILIDRVWINRSVTEFDRQSFYVALLEQALALDIPGLKTNFIVTALGPRARYWESFGFKKVKRLDIHNSSEPTWLMQAEGDKLREMLNRKTVRAMRNFLSLADRSNSISVHEGLANGTLKRVPEVQIMQAAGKGQSTVELKSIGDSQGPGHLEFYYKSNDGRDYRSQKVIGTFSKMKSWDNHYDYVELEVVAEFEEFFLVYQEYLPILDGVLIFDRSFRVFDDRVGDINQAFFRHSRGFNETKPSYTVAEIGGKNFNELFYYPIHNKVTAQQLDISMFREEIDSDIKNIDHRSSVRMDEGWSRLKSITSKPNFNQSIFNLKPIRTQRMSSYQWWVEPTLDGDPMLNGTPFSPYYTFKEMHDYFGYQVRWDEALEALGFQKK